MNSSFEQDISIVPIIIGFVVLMIFSTLLRSRLRRRHLKREGQISAEGGRGLSIEERVAGNPEWATGEIKSKGGFLVFGMWLLALVWNLTFGFSFFKQFSNPAIATGGLVVLGVFAALGLPIIGFAIRVTMRQMRFGESLCRITGKAGVLGKVLKGTISTKAEIEPEGDYSVMLQCIEHYSVGTGKNRTSKTDIKWQGKQTVARTAGSSRAGIPFAIEIPSYPPETGYQLSRGEIHWQLTISAPTKGVDYSALFIVPVFNME